jgi:CheY-like chemotaxis protein
MTRGAPTVLLVEDNPPTWELTLLALDSGKLANHIDVVRDGAEALDYLFRDGTYTDRPAQNEPRVVLLDIKLPLINGIDVLRQLKENDDTRSGAPSRASRPVRAVVPARRGSGRDRR